VDPFELRLKNANRIGDTSPTASRTPTVDRATIHAIAEADRTRPGRLPDDDPRRTRGRLLPEHLVAQVGEVDH
jgi:hypothetical protein